MAECNHDCSSCSENNCNERDFHVKTNEYSFIKKIIAVVSGKGGVGKSLVTSLVAVSLANKGLKVGILDADVTGPSIPKVFGLKDKASATEIGIMPEVTNKGIKVMSVNLLLDNPTDPVVWRGPIISGTVQQFYTDVIWDHLDVLLIDMPPGTGDVPLTVFQSIPVDGTIIVTSPQELVSMIVSKSVNMANLMKVNILGVVENMSYFHCPDNNKDYKIFGESHIDEIAKDNKIKVVGKIPIDPVLAVLSDEGEIEAYDKDYLEELVNSIINLVNNA